MPRGRRARASRCSSICESRMRRMRGSSITSCGRVFGREFRTRARGEERRSRQFEGAESGVWSGGVLQQLLVVAAYSYEMVVDRGGVTRSEEHTSELQSRQY